MDFPGDPVAENLPANAGDTGSLPGLGRFTHAPQGDEAQAPRPLSPHTNKRSHCKEKPATRVTSAHLNERKPLGSNDGPKQSKLILIF